MTVSSYDPRNGSWANHPVGMYPHSIALDSRGDIYLGEVSWTIRGQRLNPPRELRSLQKLKKLQ